jgi:DNA-directed RNA polymerase subunit omega
VARITVEDCLEKVPSRFALVMLVSKRAKQIMKGSQPTVESENKNIVTSLREVASGLVQFDYDQSSGTPEEQISKELNR